MKPDNRVVVDWLRFTFDASSWGVLDKLGLDPSRCDWVERERLKRKYYGYIMEGVMVATNNLPTPVGLIEGRFTLDFSGNGLGMFFAQSELSLLELCNICLDQPNAKASRLDIAFDDYKKYLNIDRMTRMLDEQENVSTRWEVHDYIRRVRKGQVSGMTLYIGSRESSNFCRVYDKRLQELENGASVEDLPEDWKRAELELKGSVALAVLKELVAHNFDDNVAYGYLLQKLRFHIKGDGRKSRRPLCWWWERFTKGNGRTHIVPPKPSQSVHKKMEHIIDSYAPTLATIYKATGESMTFFEFCINQGLERLTNDHRRMIAQYLEESHTHGS